MVLRGDRAGGMAAAIVQSQTQRFKNQNAESQGQSKGKGRKSAWVQEEQAHTLVTDGDRPWRGLQGELGDQRTVDRTCRSWPDSTSISSLNSPGPLKSD